MKATVYDSTVHLMSWNSKTSTGRWSSVPEDALALPPANLSFEQAAAGGGVGTFAVQIAKAFGVDRTYGLSEVPAAIRHFEEGHARGNVITVAATE